MATISHTALSGNDLHEPLGVDTAAAGKVYLSDGAGSGDWVTLISQAYEDYGDTGTAQNLTSGAWVDLTNDGAGTYTSTTYKAPGSTGIWDTANDQFDWDAGQLSLGDTVDIRVDVDITTSGANDEVALRLDIAHGDAAEFPLEFLRESFKTAGTYNRVVNVALYMGSNDILTNPCKIAAYADSASDSISVNGWFIRSVPRTPFTE
jgi:hypothetical protein